MATFFGGAQLVSVTNLTATFTGGFTSKYAVPSGHYAVVTIAKAFSQSQIIMGGTSTNPISNTSPYIVVSSGNEIISNSILQTSTGSSVQGSFAEKFTLTAGENIYTSGNIVKFTIELYKQP